MNHALRLARHILTRNHYAFGGMPMTPEEQARHNAETLRLAQQVVGGGQDTGASPDIGPQFSGEQFGPVTGGGSQFGPGGLNFGTTPQQSGALIPAAERDSRAMLEPLEQQTVNAPLTPGRSEASQLMFDPEMPSTMTAPTYSSNAFNASPTSLGQQTQSMQFTPQAQPQATPNAAPQAPKGSFLSDFFGRNLTPNPNPTVQQPQIAPPPPASWSKPPDATFQPIADQQFAPAMGPPSQADINALAHAGIGEARGQGRAGMQSVMEAIQNRADSNYSGYGRNVQQQIQAPNQFEYLENNNNRAATQAMNSNSPTAQQALDAAKGVLFGTADRTIGARTDYRAQQQGNRTSTPRSDSLVTGGHNFFNENQALKDYRDRMAAAAKAQSDANRNQSQGFGGFPSGIGGTSAAPSAPAATDPVTGLTPPSSAQPDAPSFSPGFSAPQPAGSNPVPGMIGDQAPTASTTPGSGFGSQSTPGTGQTQNLGDGDPNLAAPEAPGPLSGFGSYQAPSYSGEQFGPTSNGDPNLAAPDLPGALNGFDDYQAPSYSGEQFGPTSNGDPNLAAPDLPGELTGFDYSSLSGEQFGPVNNGDPGLEAPEAPGALSGFDDDGSGPRDGGTMPGADLVASNDADQMGAGESYTGGDGYGAAGGGGGNEEQRGGRIIDHALRKVFADGGAVSLDELRAMVQDTIRDTPEARSALYSLGKKNYETGRDSFSPQDAELYDRLARSYNFPKDVGNDATWEDQVSNRNAWLQHNRDVDVEPESYADGGEVDDPAIANALRLTTPRDEAQYDAMGNVTMPPEEGFAPSPAYDRAMDAIAKAGAAVGSPVTRALQTAADVYSDKSREAAAENEALRQQAMQNMAGDRAGMVPIGAGQMLLSQLGTATLPLTAAAKTIGHAATQATGNPRFGANVELLSGFVDPSHVGMLKATAPMAGAAAVRQAVQTAREVAPVAQAARELSPLGLYSHGAETAAGLQQAKGTPQQFRSMLEKAGVRPVEFENAGFDDAFAGKSSITKDEIAKLFSDKMPVLEEKVLGKQNEARLASMDDEITRLEQAGDPRWRELSAQRGELLRQSAPTKFQQYTLPGGENYREVLLKMPANETQAYAIKYKDGTQMGSSFASEREARAVLEDMFPGRTDLEIAPERATNDGVRTGRALTENNFHDPHWDDPNVLAHLRFSDRVGPNGEKILHMEEAQSGWGQKGRKEGFAQKLDPKILNQLGEEQTSAMFKLEDARKAFNDSYESIFKDNLKDAFKNAPTQYDLPNALKMHDDVIKSKHPQKRFDEYKSTFLRQADTFTPEQRVSLQDAYDAHLEAKDAYNAAKDKRAEYTSLSNGLPTAPYVTSTQAWTDLAIKRALREAAEGGYDMLVWTPGAEQAKRYSLSKHIDEVQYSPGRNGTFSVEAYKGNNNVFNRPNATAKEIADTFGQEIADKITSGHGEVNRNTGYNVLSGLDLEAGGEGMKGYYDKIWPNQLGKQAKKHDPSAKVEMGRMPVEGRNKGAEDIARELGMTIEQINALPDAEKRALIGSVRNTISAPGITITPKMRESILRGQPHMADGGSVVDRALTLTRGR